ncbi:MAG: hypothetical protein AAF471_00500 [Myxococcota bacterium]
MKINRTKTLALAAFLAAATAWSVPAKENPLLKPRIALKPMRSTLVTPRGEGTFMPLAGGSVALGLAYEHPLGPYLALGVAFNPHFVMGALLETFIVNYLEDLEFIAQGRLPVGNRLAFHLNTGMGPAGAVLAINQEGIPLGDRLLIGLTGDAEVGFEGFITPKLGLGVQTGVKAWGWLWREEQRHYDIAWTFGTTLRFTL